MITDVGYEKLFNLHDRGAVITGAGSGLGKAIALGFAAYGADIVIADIDATSAEGSAAQIREFGRQCLVVKTDVTRAEEVERLAEKAVAQFGRIHVLYNSAGIARLEGPAAELSEKDWDDTIALNLKGTFLCCQRIGRRMIHAGGGKIINMASTDGQAGLPEETAYCASKGGVISLTRALAIEWAKYNITVNAIAPCEFDTPMQTNFSKGRGKEYEVVALNRIPLARARGFIGQPHEIVGAALFLASDASSMVTGHVLNVDGGRLSE